jgi:8-oxo-dGTP diphosphatase
MQDTTLALPLRGQPPREVLLGLKRLGFGAGKLTGIGGKVEPGEEAVHAAARELEEEVGLVARPADLHPAARLAFEFPHRPAWSTVMHVFLLWSWRGTPVSGREIEPAWYSIDSIPYAQMWSDTRHWLPRVLAGEKIQGRFVFSADNETVDTVVLEAWPRDAMLASGLRAAQTQGPGVRAVNPLPRDLGRDLVA